MDDVIMRRIRNIEKLLEIETDPLKRMKHRRELKFLLQQLESMKSA